MALLRLWVLLSFVGVSPLAISQSWYQNQVSECRKILIAEGESLTERGAAISDSQLFSICSNILISKKIEVAAPPKPAPPTSFMGEIGRGLYYSSLAAQWIVSLGVTENLVERGIRGEIPQSVYEAFQPSPSEIQRKVPKSMRLQVLEQEKKLSARDRDLIKQLKREHENQIQAFVQRESRSRVEKVVPEIAKWVVKELPGGVNDTASIRAKLTYRLAEELVSLNLNEMGSTPAEAKEIFKEAAFRLENCLNQATAIQNQERANKAVELCGEKFAAAAPAHLASAILMRELRANLKDLLDEKAFKDITSLARIAQVQCISQRDSKENSLEQKIEIAKQCSMEAIALSFSKIGESAVLQKLKAMQRPQPGGKPPLLVFENPQEEKKLVSKIMAGFHSNTPLVGNSFASAKLNSKLIDGSKYKTHQEALRSTMATLSLNEFKLELSNFQNHLVVEAGREVVAQIIKSHPDLPREIKSDPQVLNRLVGIVADKVYDPCIRNLASKVSVKIDPERCTFVIQSSASALIASFAMDKEFEKLFRELNLKPEKYLSVVLENQNRVENCIGNLAESLIRSGGIKLTGVAGANQRIEINNCFIPGLRKYIGLASEAAMLDNIANNQQLKALLPKNPDLLQEQLKRAKVFERAEALAQECFLLGIRDLHIENLKEFLTQKQKMCQGHIERVVSASFVEILKENLANETIDPKFRSEHNMFSSKLETHSNNYRNNFAEKVGNEFIEQMRSDFGLGSAKTNYFDSPAEENKHLQSVGVEAEKLDDRLNARYSAARRSLRSDLVDDVTQGALDFQLKQLFPDGSDLQKHQDTRGKIYKEILEWAKPAQTRIKRNYQALDELDQAILNESNENKKAELERNRDALQLRVTKDEIEYEAEVRNLATERILPLKLREAIVDKVPKEADAIVAAAVEQFEACVGFKKLADTGDTIRKKSRFIAHRYRMSYIAQKSPRTIKPQTEFTASNVEDCKNEAIATATWRTVRTSVLETLMDQMPEEALPIRGKLEAMSASDCRVSKLNLNTDGQEQVLSQFANLMCLERDLNVCLVSKETNHPSGGGPGSQERIDWCLGSQLSQAAEPFASMILDYNFKKFLMLGHDSKEYSSYPGYSYRDQAMTIYHRTKVSESYKKCSDAVNLRTARGELEVSLKTQKAYLDACAALEVFKIAKAAGLFSNEIYAFSLKKREKSGGINFQSLNQEFDLCLARVQEKLNEIPAGGNTKTSTLDRMAANRITPGDVERLVSPCTAKLEQEIKKYVFEGFETRGRQKELEISRTFDFPHERALARATIATEFKNARGILEAASKYSEPSKKGPALPSSVKKQLDLVDSLVTDACLFDFNCGSHIRSLTAALEKEGKQNKTIPEKRFTELVVDSSFFDRVVLGRIQKQLKKELSSSIYPMVKGSGQYHAIQMVNFLTGHAFLANRFLYPNPEDRFGQKVPSGKPVLEKIRSRIKKFYLEGDSSMDPEGPEFLKMATADIQDFLLRDWEFLGGVFWAIAGDEVEASPEPKSFGKDIASLIGAYHFSYKTDWWGRGVRTPSGCKILKLMQKLVSDSFNGKPLPKPGVEMEKLKAEIEALYTSSVEEGVKADSWLIGSTKDVWLEPSVCLGDGQKETLREEKTPRKH